MGKWGSICDDEWDIREATVVCRELGFADIVHETHNSMYGLARCEYRWPVVSSLPLSFQESNGRYTSRLCTRHARSIRANRWIDCQSNKRLVRVPLLATSSSCKNNS